MPRLKVIVAAHGHPELSKGGAEIAAHQLFHYLRRRDDCEAWLIGCDRSAESSRTGAALTQPFSDREFIYAPGEFNWFNFANRDRNFPAEFEQLLTELTPDIVHFHHYANFGVEVFYHVRQVLPDCKIFLTLHEFLAICHHFGQMITTAHRSLCHQSSPLRCHRCFPEFSQADFFLRKRYIQRFFALVDCFIAPSRFLAERYIAWGVPEQKMAIIENVIPAVAAPPDPRPIAQDGPLRVGFFGQLSVLKGVNVLLDAADALSRDAAGDIVFEIFGDYRNQPPEFQKDFLERLPNAARNVHFHGPYDETRVDRLMQSVDAVVMPSIWWENSPIVIQEALRNRRPIICSDIGGMAEKVRDGKDGFHFPVGSATALAALIRRLVRNRGLLTELANNLAVPPSPVTITEAHMRLYRQSPSNCIQSSNFEQEHVA